MRLTAANASALFLNKVLVAVYQKEFDYVHKYVEKFFLEYRAAGNTEASGFIYLGEEYRFFTVGRLVSLPAEYKESVNSVLAEKKEIKNSEQPLVHHFFSTLLRKTKNVEVLKEILPTELHGYIDHYLKLYQDTQPLAQDIIDVYKNSPILDTIKYRLAFNLIL